MLRDQRIPTGRTGGLLPIPGPLTERLGVFPAFLTVAGLTLLAVRSRRRRPWITTGWAWRVATLLPVIGLVQFGLQARAGRYAYLPLIGLSIAVAWSVTIAAHRAGTKRRPIAAFGIVAVVALTAAS